MKRPFMNLMQEIDSDLQRLTQTEKELEDFRIRFDEMKKSFEEQVIRLEIYNDLKSETILSLQKDVERHREHKQRILAAVQRGLDNMDLLQQELHAIKMEDAEQPQKSTEKVEVLLKKLSEQTEKSRGLQDVLADHQDERPIPAFMMERT